MEEVDKTDVDKNNGFQAPNAVKTFNTSSYVVHKYYVYKCAALIHLFMEFM